jgi:hypothetical protein
MPIQKQESKTHHLLNFNFLKRTKPTCSSLHVKGATYAVLLAFLLIWTVRNGREGFAGYLLECFGTANIASVGVHKEQWLDF